MNFSRATKRKNETRAEGKTHLAIRISRDGSGKFVVRNVRSILRRCAAGERAQPEGAQNP